MSAFEEPSFCDTCLRNQLIVQNMVANYLPDEDHPDYEKLEAEYYDWRAEIEQLYPQVCKQCKERVDNQIRNAGYAAKADHLRRIMALSEKKRQIVQTSRQIWTLRLILLAKWVYISSLAVQCLWHIFGYMMAPNERMLDDGEPARFSLDICARQAIFIRSVDESCVRSPTVIRVLLYALVADGLTIWWNPRLKEKTNSITGRMHGLISLWTIRGVTFVIRGLSLYYWSTNNIDEEFMEQYGKIHIFMVTVLILSAILTWKAIRFTYHTPSTVQRSTQQQTSIPNTPDRPRRQVQRAAHTQASAFDDMVQGFTSSFQEDQPSAAFPPSPTLTASSHSTHATEATTPFGNKSAWGDDDMDWTPTQRRFAQQQPTVHPSPWRNSQEPSPPPYTTSREPHSLFREPDANPFRHRVPAAPKAPAEAKADPWRRPAWAPPLKEATPNFFKEDQQARGGVGEMKGLDGFGVPKNVKRDAELFASPKLKYDNYATPKSTGLEDTFESTFNNFFAK